MGLFVFQTLSPLDLAHVIQLDAEVTEDQAHRDLTSHEQ